MVKMSIILFSISLKKITNIHFMHVAKQYIIIYTLIINRLFCLSPLYFNMIFNQFLMMTS